MPKKASFPRRGALSLDAQQVLCAKKGHPGADCYWNPTTRTTRYWCSFCEVYFLKDDKD